MSQTNRWGTPSLFISDVCLRNHLNATMVPALALFTVMAYNRSVTYSLTKSYAPKIDILGSPALTTLTVSDPPLWSQQAFTKLRPSKGKGLGTLQHLPVSWTVTAPEFLSPIATVMFLLPAKSHIQKANWWDIILKDAHSSGVGTSCHILSIALCSVLGFHQSQNCFLQRLNCATEVQTQKHHSLKECPKNRHTHVIQL